MKRLVVAVAVATALVGGCASNSALAPNVIRAGQVDIQLPPGWKVTHDGVEAPAYASGVAATGPANAAATTTIPLKKQDPTTAFFRAAGAFTTCLKSRGVTFIGAPTAGNPSSPANDPSYVKSLEACAAQSHILQALQDFQAAQAKLTPKQIQQQNQQYLKWRTCMVGRGWTVPMPKPDSQGRLFSIGTNGAGPQIVPPKGEDPLNSPDIQACLQQAGVGGSG